MHRTPHLVFTVGLLALFAGCDTAEPDDAALRVDDAPQCGPKTLPCPDTGDTADTDDGTSSSDDGTGGSDDGTGGSDDGTGGSDDGTGGSDDDEGEADLPYNYDVQLGDTVLLDDIFLSEGPLPTAVLSLTPREGDWRLAELEGGVAFEVTQDDCDHEGSDGTGRDRFDITWQNPDGTQSSDHFTIRYCD
ncbi:MAG: hypothetical protein IPH07_17405 [Deltaproteobacteria bacterium]|nr:hypothetical protein [Deltaproteobacteria bacterium]MBK8719344.1 hypothetical protein [Deltaproteobacteria bacterium]MBP7290085.1 hypothetical protein [Nannocystaceae bacterium]